MLGPSPADFSKAIQVLNQGGVIAYPTEAVFGLGCDPFNEQAVLRLLQIKQRDVTRGLLMLAADTAMVEQYIELKDAKRLSEIYQTWPGAITWVFPANDQVPSWVRGSHASLGLRVTAHSIAHQLVAQFGKPLVSTSANLSNQEPLRNYEDVQQAFADKIDYIVPGKVGAALNPTEIRDALTGKVLRSS